MQKFISAIAFVLCLSIPAFSSTINVPADYLTIQAGIDAAVTGDTVLVAPGTYTENINYGGKNIVVASHFVLGGDYDMIDLTVIDGSEPDHPDTASCVTFLDGEDSTAVLEGFTITGGTGTMWIDPAWPASIWRGGGGVFCFSSSPTIKNNIITANDVTNTIGVSGAQGGGVHTFSGNPIIANNVISFNTSNYGCGVVVDYSGAIIRNNVIYGNYGGQSYGGGGIWILNNGAYPIIVENNTIVDNSVSGSGTYGGKGGAMFVWYGTMTGSNNIIWGNTQSQGNPIALISGGTATLSYCDVEGSYPGLGNLSIAPEFTTADFYLETISPCIDTGDTSAACCDPDDPQNPGQPLWPALGTLRNDMGAYGGPGSMKLANNINLSVDPAPDKNPSTHQLYGAYPNPFNPTTTITLDLPVASQVYLQVFDTQGRLVTSHRSPATSHYSFPFDGSGLPSGIYFYRLTAGDFTGVGKMVLLK